MITIFRAWNRNILDLFDSVMQWMLNLITNMLTYSPQTFSPEAFATSQFIANGLTNVGITILILLWGIDFGASTFSFRIKSTEEIIRLVIMLALGYAFTRVSFNLVMGTFEFFGSLVTFTGTLDINFTNFTEATRYMIDARDWGGAEWWHLHGYTMGTTENMLLFVFLVFSFLSFFGMLLGMLLVPISIFVELYIYAAFAPIPIATLLTGRKEIGIAYLKLVASVCIRGAVVMVGMNIAMGILSTNAFNAEMQVSILTGFWAFLLPIVSISISILILQKAIKGAETFARGIVGAGS